MIRTARSRRAMASTEERPQRAVLRTAIGNVSKGVYHQGGLVLQVLALTFARPRPPARTPLVLALLFSIQKQYGNKEG
jgi:hypothetical protein